MRAAIVVIFDDYYCKRDSRQCCVWLSVDFLDVLLAHVRTDEQLALLWQLVTGEGK